MTTRTTSIGVALTALFIGCRNDIGIDPEVNVPPATRITAPETGEVYETGAVVRFEGVVSDGNRIRDISRVWWTSDIDGELGQEELVALDSNLDLSGDEAQAVALLAIRAEESQETSQSPPSLSYHA